MFEPEPLAFSEEELKLIHQALTYSHEGTLDVWMKIDHHLNECRLARNPEVIASLRKGMQDIQNGNIKKVQLREGD